MYDYVPKDNARKGPNHYLKKVLNGHPWEDLNPSSGIATKYS